MLGAGTADGPPGRRSRSRAPYLARGHATALVLTVWAIILVVAVAMGTIFVRDWAENGTEETAERTAQRVTSDIARGQDGTVIAVRRHESPYIQVVGPGGRVLAASGKIRGRPALVTLEDGPLVNRELCPGFLERCVHIVGAQMIDSAYGRSVMVSAAGPVPTALSTWLLPIWVLLFLTVFLIVVGWWTRRTIKLTLAPVDDITRVMSEVSTRGLDRRVPVPNTWGEIQRLAETVNATLERLEEAHGRERRFVADASHDLRNPIAGLQTRLEGSLGEPADYDWRAMVRSALRDTERLTDIVADLLALSRLDSRAPMPVERVDLAELVRRETERRPPSVPVTTRLEPGVVVEASPVALSRVLGNLLSNAERHAESRIELTVARDGDEAVVEVLDDGSGIAEESRERVFERFARLPESRRRDPAGTGLGLPIAREIAEVHGGSLRIADSPKGARFVMRLPLTNPKPAR